MSASPASGSSVPAASAPPTFRSSATPLALASLRPRRRRWSPAPRREPRGHEHWASATRGARAASAATLPEFIGAVDGAEGAREHRARCIDFRPARRRPRRFEHAPHDGAAPRPRALRPVGALRGTDASGLSMRHNFVSVPSRLRGRRPWQRRRAAHTHVPGFRPSQYVQWTSGNTRAPPPHVVPSTVTGKTSMPLSTAVHSSSMHQSLSKIFGDMKKTSFPDARTLALSFGSSSSLRGNQPVSTGSLKFDFHTASSSSRSMKAR